MRGIRLIFFYSNIIFSIDRKLGNCTHIVFNIWFIGMPTLQEAPTAEWWIDSWKEYLHWVSENLMDVLVDLKSKIDSSEGLKQKFSTKLVELIWNNNISSIDSRMSGTITHEYDELWIYLFWGLFWSTINYLNLDTDIKTTWQSITISLLDFHKQQWDDNLSRLLNKM